MTDEILTQSLHTPGFFPKGMVPDWVTFHPDLSEGAVAIAALIQAFASPNGSLPTLGRKRIAERFGYSADSVDRRTRELTKVGFLAKVATYVDADTGERTFDERAASGARNAQTSNTWVVRDAPPMGDDHPHPISSSEFCHPEKIGERIAARRSLLAAIEGRTTPPAEGGRTHAAGGRPAETTGTPSSRGGRTHAAPPAACVRPKQEPREQDPTNQRAREESAADDGVGSAGWVDAPQEGSDDTAGARLLRSLAAADGSTLSGDAVAEHAEHVTALLNAGHSEQAVRQHLTEGGRAAGFIRSKLRKLAAGEEHLPAPQTSEPASNLPGCRTCGARSGEPWWTRTVLADPHDAHSPELACPDCRVADRAA